MIDNLSYLSRHLVWILYYPGYLVFSILLDSFFGSEIFLFQYRLLGKGLLGDQILKDYISALPYSAGIYFILLVPIALLLEKRSVSVWLIAILQSILIAGIAALLSLIFEQPLKSSFAVFSIVFLIILPWFNILIGFLTYRLFTFVMGMNNSQA